MPRYASSKGACLLAGLIALAFMCAAAVSQDKKPDTTAADADLLEFLGSVDSGGDSQTAADDGSWIEYLAQTDIVKVAKAPNPSDPSGKPSPAGDKPPAAERAEKND